MTGRSLESDQWSIIIHSLAGALITGWPNDKILTQVRLGHPFRLEEMISGHDARMSAMGSREA